MSLLDNCYRFFVQTLLFLSRNQWKGVHKWQRSLGSRQKFYPLLLVSFGVATPMFLWGQAEFWTCQNKTWLDISNENAQLHENCFVLCVCVCSCACADARPQAHAGICTTLSGENIALSVLLPILSFNIIWALHIASVAKWKHVCFVLLS